MEESKVSENDALLTSSNFVSLHDDVSAVLLPPTSKLEVTLDLSSKGLMEHSDVAAEKSTASPVSVMANELNERLQHFLAEVEKKADLPSRTYRQVTVVPRKQPRTLKTKPKKRKLPDVDLPIILQGSAGLPVVTSRNKLLTQDECYKAISNFRMEEGTPSATPIGKSGRGTKKTSKKTDEKRKKQTKKIRNTKKEEDSTEAVIEQSALKAADRKLTKKKKKERKFGKVEVRGIETSLSLPKDVDPAVADLATALMAASSSLRDVSAVSVVSEKTRPLKKKRSVEPKPCRPGCTLSTDPQHFQIGCDGCKLWYHGSCVNLTKKQADIIETYYCQTCFDNDGWVSVKKTRTNTHRHDYFDLLAEGKPTQTGTARFLEELREKEAKFAPLGDAVVTLKGPAVDIDYMQESGFKKLIFVEERSGLDIWLPDKGFSYEDVVRILGPDRVVSAIDVESQEENVIVTLQQYYNYMKSPQPRETILNIISLEFSKSEMSKLVEPPRVVKELSWVDNYFQANHEDYPPESPYAKPEVQKYCLMSAKDSYTDFHIDFGGTSVWYHIFKGSKIFYLIEPTDANLALYEEWMKAPNQFERFLGDETKCFRLELKEGNTILMPSGWIHAVFTPEDSLVFGGNFLHHLAAENQFKINNMEDRLGTPDRYRFPHFYTVCWSAFKELSDLLSDLLEERLEERHKKQIEERRKKHLEIEDESKELPEWLLRAFSTVYNTLKNESPDCVSPAELKRRKAEVMEDIDPKALLRRGNELAKKAANKHAAKKGMPAICSGPSANLHTHNS